ncbi:MAG: universal stress protein [Phycisphaerae bacterium]|nr:universal stress protein [Phycisphaerae bacterium]
MPLNPLSTILVGTDFSPCSAAALAQALRIAAWTGAAVRVVHVIDTVVAAELEAVLSPMQKSIRDSLVHDAERAWTEFAAGVPGASGLAFEVVIDNRLTGILRHARAGDADLLIVGAYGDRAPDVGIGTVATACVRKSPIDVLLVRDTRPGHGAGPFASVVAAVDFSNTSRAAVQRAAMFASKDGAAFHLLHVFQPPWQRLHYRAPTPLATPEMQKQYRDGLGRRLEEFGREAIAGPFPGLRPRCEVFECPGHRSGIVDYAASVGADLVVLGTRGRTNLRDVFLGSTAEKTLRETRCSVLAVKPRGDDA